MWPPAEACRGSDLTWASFPTRPRAAVTAMSEPAAQAAITAATKIGSSNLTGHAVPAW